MTTTDAIPILRRGEESKLFAKIKDHPEQLSSYRRLARLLSKRDQPEQAVFFLKQALRLAPKDRETLLLLAQILEGSEKFEESLKILKKTIRLFPERYLAYERLGRVYKKLGKKLLITRTLKTIGSDSPIRERALKRMVLVYKEEGKYSQALLQLDLLIKEFGWDFSRAKDRARFLDRLNRKKEAIRDYRRAIKFKPDDPDTRLLLGLCLKNLDKRPEARETFLEMIGIKHGYYGGHIQLAEMDIEEEKLVQARKHLLKLEARWPGNSRVNLDLAKISLLRGDPEKALEIALANYCLTPFYYSQELALGYGVISEALAQMGKMEEGRIYRLLAQAVIKGPDFFGALSGLVTRLLKQGNLAQAEAVADEMLKRFSENSRAQALKAEILIAQERLDEAVKYASGAAREDNPRYLNDKISGLNLLEKIYKIKGQKEEAARCTREIKKLSSPSP